MFKQPRRGGSTGGVFAGYYGIGKTRSQLSGFPTGRWLRGEPSRERDGDCRNKGGNPSEETLTVTWRKKAKHAGVLFLTMEPDLVLKKNKDTYRLERNEGWSQLWRENWGRQSVPRVRYEQGSARRKPRDKE